MRSFRHWTPLYIWNRLNEIAYHKMYPEHPWLTKHASLILSSLLKETDIGLEWGSGRSTLWFAQRVKKLTSVEHNKNWYDKILKKLQEDKLNGKVDYIFIPSKENKVHESGLNDPYVRIVDKFDNISLDFALIDGIFRSSCTLAVLDKIKYGGILIIDNANWFLPSNSISPNSVRGKPISEEWGKFITLVQNWRVIWTSSGVTDTAIWIKACKK